jgi:hypothetical protein
MNERIKQLAEQAFFDESTSRPSTKMYTFSEHKMEKFAELIINECIDQVAGTKIVAQGSGDEFGELSESARNKYKQWNNALVIATMNVKDHFGIEE